MMDRPHVDASPPSPRSLADMVAVPEASSRPIRLDSQALLKLAVLAILFTGLNWEQFKILSKQWLNDPNWTHSFLIPLFSLFLLYSRRIELLSTPRNISLWGLPLLFLALLMGVFGVFVGTFWFWHLSMLPMLMGLVLYLCGWKMLKLTAVPICFLVFAMPIPEMLYSQIANPLQEFAAKGATTLLQMVGAKIQVTASNLSITSVSGHIYSLTVVEACSGVRSLMMYLALGVAWAYLESYPLWQRIVLVGAAIPIAILTNVLRITITCSMFIVDRPELGQDFMHEFTGMLMLIPAILLFWLLNNLLNSLLVEVDDEQPPPAKREDA